MEKPLTPSNEQARLAALYRYDILDTEFEKNFDDIANIASILCNTPIALVSFVDPDRQWFKAARGISVRETPREIAFCAHAINSNEVLIVPDALEDSRFHDNPLVTGEPKVRFYAGAPLITNDGYVLGTLCSIDSVPRKLSKEQISGLEALSRQVCRNLELRHRTRILTEINESKNRLFSIISHDLRSPLNNLTAVIDHLFEDSDSITPTERAEWLASIRKSATTSLTIAENLLKWARFEEGTVQFNPEPMDLESFLEHIHPTLEGNARTKNIQLTIETIKNVSIYADPTMLHSIIQNIVSNSIKFTPENGTVSITTELSKEGAQISITDSGIGMSATTKENLFKIEKTYSTLGTDGEKGSGLGLCLCKQFADKMNASLKIESEKDQGTTITLTLPIA